jgi:hypothetical protein
LRNEQIQEDNYKQKLFLTQKWQYLKLIKVKMIEENKKKVEKMKIVRHHLHYLLLAKYLKHIAKVYSDKRDHRMW